MSSILNANIPYNLRSSTELYCRNPKTVKYGTETISHLAPKIWSLVPEVLKLSYSLNAFKSNIRQWEPDWPCRLCKTYLQHVVSFSILFIYFFKSTTNVTYLIRFETILL